MCNHPKSPTKICVCVFHPDMNMGVMQFNSSKMFYLSLGILFSIFLTLYKHSCYVFIPLRGMEGRVHHITH